MAQFIVISETPKARATAQSRGLRPRNEGRTTASRIRAEVANRSHTIAVGGTRPNRSLAIAAPNWTEKIPPTTSQTAGIRSSRPAGDGDDDAGGDGTSVTVPRGPGTTVGSSASEPRRSRAEKSHPTTAVDRSR